MGARLVSSDGRLRLRQFGRSGRNGPLASAGIHHQHVQRRGRLVPGPALQVHVDGAVLRTRLRRGASADSRARLGRGEGQNDRPVIPF